SDVRVETTASGALICRPPPPPLNCAAARNPAAYPSLQGCTSEATWTTAGAGAAGGGGGGRAPPAGPAPPAGAPPPPLHHPHSGRGLFRRRHAALVVGVVVRAAGVYPLVNVGTGGPRKQDPGCQHRNPRGSHGAILRVPPGLRQLARLSSGVG